MIIVISKSGAAKHDTGQFAHDAFTQTFTHIRSQQATSYEQVTSPGPDAGGTSLGWCRASCRVARAWGRRRASRPDLVSRALT